MHESIDPALYWIGLSSIPGVGRATFRKLVTHFGSPERALNAGRDELSGVDGLPDRVIAAVSTTSWREFAERELELAERSETQIVTANSDSYPAGLKNTPDAPPFLYVRGSLQAVDGIAIVGTRRPTHYGVRVARGLAAELAAAGLTVVSGLARGIDTQAHRGALDARGRTIAVLGCGIDVVYPAENRDLLHEIIGSGAVVTENPFGTKPEAGYFPARNRIISGLARGTVIIEAAEDSGSLITAEYTRQQGRKLFAVPGNVGSPSSRGANSLIKQGALLVEDAGDILRELGIRRTNGPRQQAGRPGAELDRDESAAYGCITGEPKHIDVIMNESRLSASRLSGTLITLELKGLVKQLPGKYYVRAVG